MDEERNKKQLILYQLYGYFLDCLKYVIMIRQLAEKDPVVIISGFLAISSE